MEIKKLEIASKGKKRLLSIGSGCVIIKNGKVLLVRGRGGDKYKFPGGHINDEESIRAAAVREAKEEIKVVTKVFGDPFLYLFKFNNQTDIVLIHYQAEIINGKPSTTSEIVEVVWFRLAKMPSNIFDNVKPALEYFAKSIV